MEKLGQPFRYVESLQKNWDYNIDRFFNHITIAESGCWEWNKAKNKEYGRFYYNHTNMRAHRFSYLIYTGDLIPEMFVCHTCDNRRCVNPSHLFLGTNQDNMDDMIKKGRANKARGERAAKSKLKNDQVIFILQSKIKYQDLADMFGVSFWAISRIKRKESWKHITI